MQKVSFLSGLINSIFDKSVQTGISNIRSYLNRKLEYRQLIDELLRSKGEISSRKNAEILMDVIDNMEKDEIKDFLHYLSEHLEVNTNLLEIASKKFIEKKTSENLLILKERCESKRLDLFRKIAASDKGIIRLVKFRELLLKQKKDFPNYEKIDTDLCYLLKEWFNKGFLVMRPISWSTPANILEKIIKYEAVHEIKSWRELRQRLDPTDRQCFAFFHPVMENEPIIFVEVAFMKEIPKKIKSVLDINENQIEPIKANTAVFYSISNCQTGLQGISFGNFLIKSVVENIKNELPNISNFVTLSPVPGLRIWLKKYHEDFDQKIQRDPSSLFSKENHKIFRSLLSDYFLVSKRKDNKPNDPVSRFHLGNGASLYQINLEGDESQKSMLESFGVMVNYKYELNQVEKNHEAYQNENKIVLSSFLKRWLR